MLFAWMGSGMSGSMRFPRQPNDLHSRSALTCITDRDIFITNQVMLKNSRAW